jgi:hypothetical protein
MCLHLNLTGGIDCCRSWKPRMIAWSNRVVKFSRIGEAVAIDSIPLHEIVLVSKMNHDDINMLDSRSMDSRFPAYIYPRSWIPHTNAVRASQFEVLLQIKTIPEGFNSGRTYYLKTSSDDNGNLIISKLETAIRHHRKKHEIHTRFEKSQKSVKKFISSTFFKSASCLLILAVRNTPAALQQHRNRIFLLRKPPPSSAILQPSFGLQILVSCTPPVPG